MYSVKMETKKNTWVIIAAFISVYIFWGATYLFNKIVVINQIPAFLWVGFRSLIAGMLLFIIAYYSKNKLPSRSDIKNGIIAGFLLITLGNGLLVWTLKYIDSGFVAMSFASQPLIVMLSMWVLYGKKIQLMSWIGIALGASGMYILIEKGGQNINHQNGFVLLVLISAIFSWSMGILFVSRTKSKNSQNTFYWVSGIQMFSAGIILLMMSLIIENPQFSTLNINTEVIVSMVYLVLFGSIAAYLAFNYLLQHVEPDKVSTQALVNPVVAVILGVFYLDEEFNIQSIMASTILLTGTYFINSTNTKFKRVK